MLYFIGYLIISAAANAFRGCAMLPRVVCAAVITAAAASYLLLVGTDIHPFSTILLSLLVWVGFMPGWGLYMGAAVDGIYRKEDEDLVTDGILLALFETRANLERHPYLAGMAGMTLRFAIWFAGAIILAGGTFVPLLFVGPAYYLAGRLAWCVPAAGNPVRIAEVITGALLYTALVF